jgi:hypothetical protein
MFCDALQRNENNMHTRALCYTKHDSLKSIVNLPKHVYNIKYPLPPKKKCITLQLFIAYIVLLDVKLTTIIIF